MDISTIISIVIAFASLILAFVLEGGHVGSLLQPTAALIVFGGTIGAIGVSFRSSILKKNAESNYNRIQKTQARSTGDN